MIYLDIHQFPMCLRAQEHSPEFTDSQGHRWHPPVSYNPNMCDVPGGWVCLEKKSNICILPAAMLQTLYYCTFFFLGGGDWLEKNINEWLLFVFHAFGG